MTLSWFKELEPAKRPVGKKRKPLDKGALNGNAISGRAQSVVGRPGTAIDDQQSDSIEHKHPGYNYCRQVNLISLCTRVMPYLNLSDLLARKKARREKARLLNSLKPE